MQKLLKSCEENRRKATIYNAIIVLIKNPVKKIKKHTLSYIDFASLKPIMRKLLK
jgi:hypothetical protein